MKIVCAWCLCDMGEKPGPAAETSHGICWACRAIYFPDTIEIVDGLTPREVVLMALALAAFLVFWGLVLLEAL